MFTSDAPKWHIVLDLLEPLDVGDTLTYEEIAEALDTTVDAFKRNRYPLTKAANEWGASRLRALCPVPNVGYRVVDAKEHETLARSQHRKSRRALGRGRTLLRNADRSRLDPADAARFDSMEQTLSRHEDMIRRIDGRQNRTEEMLRETRRASADTEAKVKALEETLHRHGIGESQDPPHPQPSSDMFGDGDQTAGGTGA
jgi:hypothetical protein